MGVNLADFEILREAIAMWLKETERRKLIALLSLRVQTRPKPLNFSDVKILSMPSSGWEVKESVPCPSFAVRKRT